jgi:hypothetical protein
MRTSLRLAAVLRQTHVPNTEPLSMVATRIRRARYYVIATPQGESRGTWRWEIRRKWKPVGLTYSEGGFSSRQEAEAAGKIVLEDLLNRLALES